MMILFWIIIAFMILLALLFVLWPLLKKHEFINPSHSETNLAFYQSELTKLDEALDNGELSPANYKKLKDEAKKGLLEDVSESKVSSTLKVNRSLYTALLLILLVPISSLYLYYRMGDSSQLSEYFFQKSHAKEIQAEIKQFKNPQQLIAKLQTVLTQHPDSAKGWFLLGRLYSGTSQYQDAQKAFAKAIEFAPENVVYKQQYAEASFFANDKKLTPKAQKILQSVLDKQPNNPSAINLVALNAFSQKQYQKAIDAWEKLLNLFPANTEDGKVILNAINEAEKRMGVTSTNPIMASDPQIKVHVNISKHLKQQLNPHETVFIYAKSTHGLPMPLAIVRKQVKDFPITVLLNNSKAMLAQNNLSSAKSIYIIARISKSGQAMQSAGDIQTRSKEILLTKHSKVDVTLNF